MTSPLTLCFTATVNWDPGDNGQINADGSEVCYQDPDGQEDCEAFDNPSVDVGGRKIAGDVFYDRNGDGHRDEDEEVVSGVIVRTSTGLTATTSASEGYVLRTSSEPNISVTVEMSPGHVPTTPISENISSGTDIYTVDFGIYDGVCVRGMVFNDVDYTTYGIQDDNEPPLAGATVAASGGTSMTTDASGRFAVFAPAISPITITEIDPVGYTSVGAQTVCSEVEVIDSNTLCIRNPSAGTIYRGNTFGDVLLPSPLPLPRRLYLPIVLKGRGLALAPAGWP